MVDTREELRKIPLTLQEQLINSLIKDIRELPSNSKMLSERKIADKYEISRTTVRAALKELESTGIIRRVHGKGTFVNQVNLNSDLNSSYSFSQQMILLGKQPETKILLFDKRKASAYFSEKLAIEQGDLMIKVKRLRSADGMPMMLERTYLPEQHFPTLTAEMLERKTMYNTFREDFNEHIFYADEFFTAGIVNYADAKLMNLNEGDPCLNLQRITYNRKNEVIEFTRSIARSDQFSYHIRHKIGIGKE